MRRYFHTLKPYLIGRLVVEPVSKWTLQLNGNHVSLVAPTRFLFLDLVVRCIGSM
jgi:hypothetical protein